MGIFLSCCEDNEDICNRCSRRGVPLTNNECQHCRNSRFVAHERSLQVLRPRDNEDICNRCSRRGLPLTNNECQHCRNSRLAAHERSLQVTRPRVPRSTQAYRPPPKEAKPRPVYIIPKKEPLRPLFGEYRCSCGRTWNSRRSWHQKKKTCRDCKKTVLPHTQRELRPEDMEERSREVGMLDHPQELCEMCQDLGYYCGKYKY